MIIPDWQQEQCFVSGKGTGLEVWSSLDFNIEKKQFTRREGLVTQTRPM